MLKKTLITAMAITMPLSINLANANQPQGISCGTEDAMQKLYAENPSSVQEAASLELMTVGNNHTRLLPSTTNTISMQSSSAQSVSAMLAANPTYVIPVVFHVYGTSHNGKAVDDAVIIDALRKTNEDFQGLANDFNSIIPEFSGVKDTLNIEFRLAKKSPNGSATTGIVYHASACGAGNYSDSNVATDNWNNYKYMNVYIQNDLYCNGSTTNSGVAWYPDTYMSDQGIARVAYNGAYLGYNTSENFRSVLTHEFGHYLNLIHTFEGGCSASNENYCSSTGDEICDTPQVDHSGLQGAANCMGQITNWQNFMHYSDQYAMFTYNQVSRMINALNGGARNTLWTQANLIDTGTDGGTTPSNQSPVAVANGPYSGSTSSAISFSSSGSNDPDGTISSYSWNFGDGTSSSSANPTHSYSASGSYTVTLTVTDNKGATGSDTATVSISGTGNGLSNGVTVSGLSANTGASLNYYIDVPSGATDLQVSISGGSGDADLYTQFNAQPTDNSYSCRPYAGGNNENCNEPNPSAGRWHVRVKAYSSFSGLSLVASYTNGSGGNIAPTAVVNGPYTGDTGANISFSSSGSNDTDGTVTDYSWSFGDGSSSTSANPVHAYSSQGTYSVTLTVTDNGGKTASATTTATVAGGPPTQGIPDACASQAAVDYVQLHSATPLCVTAGNGDTLYFYFYNDGYTSATIRTGHGSGDATLYYSSTGWPTSSQYEQVSSNSGNIELITINNLPGGWNYVSVTGNHSGLSLMLEAQ